MSFTAFPLDKLPISQNVLQTCHRANLFNAADILLAPVHDLARKTRLRLPEVQALVRDVSRGISPLSSIVGDLVAESSTAATARGDSTGVSDIAAAFKNGPQSVDGGSVAAAAAASGLGKRKRPNGRDARRKDEDFAEGEWIRTGDEGWDRLFGGGIRVGCITEITGESAAGKSHLCLHLALAAQLPALSTSPGGAIILTSERQLSTTRLHHLADALKRRHASNVFMSRDKLSDGVYTNRVADVEGLDHALTYGVPALLDRARATAGEKEVRAGSGTGRLMGFVDLMEDSNEVTNGVDEAAAQAPANGIQPHRQHPPAASGKETAHPRKTTRLAPTSLKKTSSTTPPIRLLILDSITALLRGADTAFSSSSAGLTARSRHLCVIADKLKALAVEYQIAVVVINQVSDVFERNSYPAPRRDEEEDEQHPAEAHLATPHGQGQGQGDGAHRTPFKPSQSHPGSSQSLTHSQAWFSSGPDPPMLYATQSKWFSGQASAKSKEAALGVVWANAVNARIILCRTERRRVIRPGQLGKEVEAEEERWRLSNPLARLGSGVLGGGVNGPEEGTGEVTWAVPPDEGAAPGRAPSIYESKILIRKAHVVFSPFAPTATVDFVITGTGLHTLPESYRLEESGGEIYKRMRKRREGVQATEEEEEGEDADGDEGDVGDGMGADAGGAGYDDLFGGVEGLEDIPEGWWEGQVHDGEAANTTM